MNQPTTIRVDTLTGYYLGADGTPGAPRGRTAATIARRLFGPSASLRRVGDLGPPRTSESAAEVLAQRSTPYGPIWAHVATITLVCGVWGS